MPFHKTDCQCRYCSSLSPKQLAELHERQKEQRSKGGKARAAQPSFAQARKQGGITTYNNAIMSGDIKRIRHIEHLMGERNVRVANARGCSTADVKREYLGETHAGLITERYKRVND